MTKSNKKRSPLPDRQLRYPGQSLDSEIEKLRWNIAIYAGLSSILIVLAFYEWWHWYRNIPPQPIATIIIAAVIVVYSSVKIGQMLKRLRNDRLGQMGEREVAQTIDKLILQGYTIYHDVLAPGFNIDHVVISPRGIFAIETKTYSKPVGVKPVVDFNGEKVTLAGYLPNSKPIMEANHHADWLRKILGRTVSTKKLFTVKPVVVFPGWWYEDTGNNKDTWVLNPGQLEAWIAQEPISLTEADMAIAEARLGLFSTTLTPTFN